jgi:hypothetical protein
MKSARGLLINERWVVNWVDNQRKKAAATEMSRDQRLYGPEGDRLMTAAYADELFGIVIFFVGFPPGLLTSGLAEVPAICIFVIAAGLFMLAFVRVAQAWRAGKVYRADRDSHVEGRTS